MKPVFEASDFHMRHPDMWIGIAQKAADIANKKLEELMRSWPWLYGYYGKNGWVVTSSPGDHDTHIGKLAFAEELPKEPCKHDGLIKLTGNIGECLGCGQQLRRTYGWEEVE